MVGVGVRVSYSGRMARGVEGVRRGTLLTLALL